MSSWGDYEDCWLPCLRVVFATNFIVSSFTIPDESNYINICNVIKSAIDMKSFQSRDPSMHPSIHSIPSAYQGFGHGCSWLSRVFNIFQLLLGGFQDRQGSGKLPKRGTQESSLSGARNTSELFALSLKLSSVTQQEKLLCLQSFFQSLTRAHDHRWEWSLNSKKKALPSGLDPFYPDECSTMPALFQKPQH